MIGIIDYGMGNLHSVKNACDYIGLENVISSNPDVLKKCDKLILPGVGAMEDCMDHLKKSQLYDYFLEETNHGKPVLGICLGMQAFYEFSEEDGGVDCFGLIKGKAKKMEDPSIRIPHIGWNELVFEKDHPLLEKISSHPYVYFDHSYFGSEMDEADLVAYANYGPYKVPGIVSKGNLLACQFHPEKSGKDGLAILEYFGREFV